MRKPMKTTTIKFRLSLLALIPLSTLFALYGCGKQEAQKAQPEQSEISIPVRVTNPAIREIAEIRKYSGVLSGLNQTMVKVMLAERIVKIHAPVGTQVRKDQVLATLSPEGNSPQIEQAAAAVELARKSVERLQKVFEAGGISQQQLDEAQTQLRMAEANQLAISRTTRLLSPTNGIITDVFYREGLIPQPDTYMFSLARLDQMVLNLQISAQEIGLFRRGLLAWVELGGARMEGEVSKVALAADPMTRFFPVEIMLKNDNMRLLPGMFVEASVRVRSTTALTAPIDALHYEKGKYYAFRVQGERADRIPVEVGINDEAFYEIVEGLKPEDTIVLEGHSRIVGSAKIKVQP